MLGLVPTEVRAVLALWHSGPLTIGDLARRLHMSSAASSIMMDRLQERGFVERVPHSVDRRRVVARLTPTAEQALKDAGERIGGNTGINPGTTPIDPMPPSQST